MALYGKLTPTLLPDPVVPGTNRLHPFRDNQSKIFTSDGTVAQSVVFGLDYIAQLIWGVVSAHNYPANEKHIKLDDGILPFDRIARQDEVSSL